MFSSMFQSKHVGEYFLSGNAGKVRNPKFTVRKTRNARILTDTMRFRDANSINGLSNQQDVL
jgi:hypothetical protein